MYNQEGPNTKSKVCPLTYYTNHEIFTSLKINVLSRQPSKVENTDNQVA